MCYVAPGRLYGAVATDAVGVFGTVLDILTGINASLFRERGPDNSKRMVAGLNILCDTSCRDVVQPCPQPPARHVRTLTGRPRSWANLSLLQLCSHGSARASWPLLGQP